MIKIRSKLLIYFSVIVFLIIAISLLLFQGNQKVFDLYDDSLEQFLLLNEVSQSTNRVVQSLTIYALEPVSENYRQYEEHKEELTSLHGLISKEDKNLPLKNYERMISSFLQEAEQSVSGIQKGEIRRYSYHLNEAEKIAQYIHETTLSLINDELNQYKEVFPEVKESISNIKKIGLLIFSVIILFSTLFAFWFSNGITKTIEGLTEAARAISKGTFTGEDVQVSTKDELWFLTKTFNHMRQNIHHLVQEMEEKSRLAQLLKEMELRSLQNQINPHFLFNTLNTISKTAYLEGATRTNELIISTSSLLRYNLGNIDKPIILKDEVKIVQDYFFIQKTRFGDRVQFDLQVEESCLTLPIPCLTLQPIVENSFIHGIEELVEGAKIGLRIFRDGEYVVIEVSDNGVGMNEETQKRLLATDEKETDSPQSGQGHSTGIGMKNVIDRLQIFYKQRCSISIDSTLGEGTTISLRLPIL
ncbi:sensor histidine kinase [Halalkalibacter urbisdiaboli]|uniref:sensor histidine kinase n=1 Tax=Halalkalibacter urbisdiaboli TaxID=1960589 RepID=UPI000B43437A|nr:histidine kinase [Halalkalibacter urbisdiaboli]